MRSYKALIPRTDKDEDGLGVLLQMMKLMGFTVNSTDLMHVAEITPEKLTEWTKRTGMPHWGDRHLPTPRTLMELAKVDPTVNAVMKLWMAGELAWEQALMMMVCCLSTDKDHYQQKLAELATGPKEIVIPMCKDPQHQREFMESLKGKDSEQSRGG